MSIDIIPARSAQSGTIIAGLEAIALRPFDIPELIIPMNGLTAHITTRIPPSPRSG